MKQRKYQTFAKWKVIQLNIFTKKNKMHQLAPIIEKQTLSTKYLNKFLRNSLQEVKKIAVDAMMLRPFSVMNKNQLLFDCNGQNALNQWHCASDRSIGGYSTASLKLSPQNKRIYIIFDLH